MFTHNIWDATEITYSYINMYNKQNCANMTKGDYL